MSRNTRAEARRARLGIVAVVLLASTLSGCTATKAEIGTSVAKSLEASVMTVTKSAAAGDPAAALLALAALQTQLTRATASGAVSADRQARIQASIDLVRADLTAALPPKPAPTITQTTAPSSNDGPDTKDDKGAPSKGKGKDPGTGPGKNNGNNK
ncbi:hypothetical protein [Leifsonia sp. Root112D2]|uniref:hypothetical protein n=1 Tax=Leifsonia sp. Root112D2 TaxID=1736426 RepID=UPI0006F290FC|nr:hypothetical protein [Leifsonia sp. Root112D2]KQV05204.1 hypothetical protein ASC63_15585 [Leifsonia sp. Root112D2]